MPSSPSVDPLLKIAEAERSRLLPPALTTTIRRRMRYVEEGVARVEKAAGLAYPPYYVEPILPLMSGLEYGQLGVLFARTFPLDSPAGLQIVVQLTAPLIAYGTKSSIHAILAHEFLHYVELARRFMKTALASDPAAGTLFEATYADRDRLYEAKRLLADRGLLRLLANRFRPHFHDPALEARAAKRWIEGRLPIVQLMADSNVARVPVAAVLRARLDPQLRRRLDQLEHSSAK